MTKTGKREKKIRKKRDIVGEGIGEMKRREYG